MAVGGLSGGWAREELPGAADEALAAAAADDGAAAAALVRRPLAVLVAEAGARVLAVAEGGAAGQEARAALIHDEDAEESRAVLFAAVFVKPPAALLRPPPDASPHAAAPAEPHMTLAHRAANPAALAALLGRGLLGARALLTATHRVTARWPGEVSGAPEQAVCCLVVGAATLQQQPLQVAQASDDAAAAAAAADLLPCVAAGHPHVTLWTDGGAPRALSRFVLQLLAAASPGALAAAAETPAAAVYVEACDVRFSVEALSPPLVLTGAISTRE